MQELLAAVFPYLVQLAAVVAAAGFSLAASEVKKHVRSARAREALDRIDHLAEDAVLWGSQVLRQNFAVDGKLDRESARDLRNVVVNKVLEHLAASGAREVTQALGLRQPEELTHLVETKVEAWVAANKQPSNRVEQVFKIQQDFRDDPDRIATSTATKIDTIINKIDPTNK